jgi:hypothetical protein
MSGNDDDPQSLHRYLYAADDPVNNSDPSGNETMCEFVVSCAIRATLISARLAPYYEAYNVADNTKTFIEITTSLALTGTVDPLEVVSFGMNFIPGEKILAKAFKLFCFTAGTQVLMADGKLKQIERIKVGDLVISREEKTGKTTAKKVLQTFKHKVYKTLVLKFNDRTQVECTPEHPFYVQGVGFVSAGDLGIGNSIVTRAGPCLKLVQVISKKRAVFVYNLEIEDDHTYFVTNRALWVHNKCT